MHRCEHPSGGTSNNQGVASVAGLAALAHNAKPRQTSGMTYTGEWKDGNYNGRGTDTYPDGTTHTGEWKDGKPVP